MKTLPRFSIGTGDRFGLEGEAQLAAVAAMTKESGIEIAPVWNKSFREHTLVGSRPEDVRAEADAAVAALKWDHPFFVDADHIRLSNVEAFASSSDFFTIDVADFIGRSTPAEDCEDFALRHATLAQMLRIDGIEEPIELSSAMIQETASKYLAAIHAASDVYRKIRELRNDNDFSIEVSMDETATPQTPSELLVILAGLADEGIPLQTIAPKFSGEFHKGIDYIGDPLLFAAEFDADVCIVKFAAKNFGLPDSLKLSVHSGSDKFSIYRHIAESVRKHHAGVHLKTAGTTWLEEVAGLAASGQDGLAVAKKIYAIALPRLDALAAPYSAVISIDRGKLPSMEEVLSWDSKTFAASLVHDESEPLYDPNFRQLIHIAYSVAAEMGPEFTDAIKRNRATVSEYVTKNLLERHLRPLFG